MRSAATPQDFYEFHRDLFTRFLATQRLLEELAEQKQTSKAELRAAKTQGDHGEFAKLEAGAPQMVIDYAEEPAYWTTYEPWV